MARLWHSTKRNRKHLRFRVSHIWFMHQWATTFSPLAFCCGRWRPMLLDKTVSTILAMTFCRRCSEERRCTHTTIRRMGFPGEPAGMLPVYWRDVGTLEAYYEAHMDLCGLLPSLNIYNRRWPIRTASYPDPGAKFTFDEEGLPWSGHRFDHLWWMHSRGGRSARLGARARCPRAKRKHSRRLDRSRQLHHRTAL